MAELVVVGFDNPNEADQVLTELFLEVGQLPIHRLLESVGADREPGRSGAVRR